MMTTIASVMMRLQRLMPGARVMPVPRAVRAILLVMACLTLVYFSPNREVHYIPATGDVFSFVDAIPKLPVQPKVVPKFSNDTLVIYDQSTFNAKDTVASFLGGMKNVFFINNAPVIDGHETPKKRTAALRALLNCTYSSPKTKDLIKRHWLKNSAFCGTVKMQDCKKNSVDLPTSTAACKGAALRVATLSDNVAGFSNELEHILASGARIIHIVSDPRTVMTEQKTKKVVKYCQKVLNDLALIRFRLAGNQDAVQKQYLLLRYEELVDHPADALSLIPRHMRLFTEDAAQAWAANHPSKKSSRDARWRLATKWEPVNSIQRECGDYMDIFGYEQLRSVSDVFALPALKYLYQPVEINSLFNEFKYKEKH